MVSIDTQTQQITYVRIHSQNVCTLTSGFHVYAKIQLLEEQWLARVAKLHICKEKNEAYEQ